MLLSCLLLKNCFNPHPPLLAGETDDPKQQLAYLAVSIHTRHYWRVKQLCPLAAPADARVSIHTRHYWRVKPRWPATPWAAWRFNPHPPLLAGETNTRQAYATGLWVSIHTRHYWRVKPKS